MAFSTAVHAPEYHFFATSDIRSVYILICNRQKIVWSDLAKYVGFSPCRMSNHWTRSVFFLQLPSSNGVSIPKRRRKLMSFHCSFRIRVICYSISKFRNPCYKIFGLLWSDIRSAPWIVIEFGIATRGEHMLTRSMSKAVWIAQFRHRLSTYFMKTESFCEVQGIYSSWRS